MIKTAQAAISIVAAGLGVTAIVLTIKKRDGSMSTVADVAEVSAAPLIDSPAPEQIREAWVDPSGRGLKYKPLFDSAEKQFGIPAGLLYRQGYQESRFRAEIIDGRQRSSARACGIMQIIPSYHPEISSGDLQSDTQACLDPKQAVPFAARLLAKWFKQFGSWELALAAYNAGPGNVQKHGGVPPFTETKNYVSQITADVPVRNV
jgi:soluble lytic murein transglycosylase-like protein